MLTLSPAEVVGPIHWSALSEHQFVWRGEDWRDFILQPGADAHARSEAHAINACGIYGLFAADEELIYIGKSFGIGYRMLQHAKERKPWASCSFINVPPAALREVELAHIAALEPPYNSRWEQPRWRGHHEMAAEITRVWAPHCVEVETK